MGNTGHIQSIDSFSTVHDRGMQPDLNQIVSDATQEDVVSAARADGVVARPAHQLVCVCVADQRIRTGSTNYVLETDELVEINIVSEGNTEQ